MDMYEANEDTFDTLSLSDLHIYNDPSCYSFQEEQDNGSSFSSISFKLAGSLPAEEIAFIRNLMSLPENDSVPCYKAQKSLRMKSFPVQDGGKMVDFAPVLRPKRRRRAGRGFLMFGLGGSLERMEVYDLRSIQARAIATPPRIFPVNGGGEEATMRPKSSSRLRKLFGACIPKGAWPNGI